MADIDASLSARERIPSVQEALDRLAMPLVDAMMTQRAVRRVLPDPVDDALVLKCIELALRAPSGSNGQNWEWVIVKDRAVKEEFASRYRQAWTLYGGLGWRRSGDDDGMRKILRAVEWQVENFVDIPVLVVPCLRTGVLEGRVPFMPMPHVATSSFFGSIYPSVQNLLLAARAMGLGASLITLPLWSVTWARSILDLPRSVTPCCMVPLGWPQGRYGPTSRRPIEQVVHLDQFNHQPWLDAQTTDPDVGPGVGPTKA